MASPINLQFYNTLHSSINLLDIPKELIKQYKKSQKYSISFWPDSDYGVGEWRETILKESSTWWILAGAEILPCKYTEEEFDKMKNQRLTKILATIGLDVQEINEIEWITYIIFVLAHDNLENYRTYLTELLNAHIAQENTVFEVDKIEEFVWSRIMELSNLTGNSELHIKKKDFYMDDLFEPKFKVIYDFETLVNALPLDSITIGIAWDVLYVTAFKLFLKWYLSEVTTDGFVRINMDFRKSKIPRRKNLEDIFDFSNDSVRSIQLIKEKDWTFSVEKEHSFYGDERRFVDLKRLFPSSKIITRVHLWKISKYTVVEKIDGVHLDLENL